MNKNRIVGLDLLKIIACLGVVGLHTIGKDSSEINRILYYLCGYAIPCFFMVHGYFILNKAELKCTYLIKKAMNFLLIILGWNFLLAIMKICVNGDRINPFKEMIREMMLQRGFFFQFWYFGALFLLYCITPLLYKILHSSKKNIIAIIFLLIIICIDLISAFCMKKLGAPLQSYVKQPFRIWTWIFYFYCGGLIRGVNHQVVDKIIEKKYIILIISVVINLAYDYGIGYKVLGIEWAEYFYDNIFMIFECVFVFLIFKEIEVHNWNAEKWIYELSSLSMGVLLYMLLLLNI